MPEHKRIGVDKPQSENQNSESLGFFNSKGHFCLTQEDIPHSYKHFELLYVNRL
jgi:hypothetical protein